MSRVRDLWRSALLDFILIIITYITSPVSEFRVVMERTDWPLMDDDVVVVVVAVMAV